MDYINTTLIACTHTHTHTHTWAVDRCLLSAFPKMFLIIQTQKHPHRHTRTHLHAHTHIHTLAVWKRSPEMQQAVGWVRHCGVQEEGRFTAGVCCVWCARRRTFHSRCVLCVVCKKKDVSQQVCVVCGCATINTFHSFTAGIWAPLLLAYTHTKVGVCVPLSCMHTQSL